jgi:hypothetical protein
VEGRYVPEQCLFEPLASLPSNKAKKDRPGAAWTIFFKALTHVV